MIVTLLRQFKSFVLLKVNLNALVLFFSTLKGVNNVLQVRGRKIAVRIVFLHNVSTEYLTCQYARLWVIPLRFYFGAAQTSQKAANKVQCLMPDPNNHTDINGLKERKWELTLLQSVLKAWSNLSYLLFNVYSIPVRYCYLHVYKEETKA